MEYGKELYTILGHKDIFFFRRVDAVLKTKEVAVSKGTSITMLLNGTPFCEFQPTGQYTYVYDPSKDKKSSPALKQLFIQKGLVLPQYRLTA